MINCSRRPRLTSSSSLSSLKTGSTGLRSSRHLQQPPAVSGLVCLIFCSHQIETSVRKSYVRAIRQTRLCPRVATWAKLRPKATGFHMLDISWASLDEWETGQEALYFSPSKLGINSRSNEPLKGLERVPSSVSSGCSMPNGCSYVSCCPSSGSGAGDQILISSRPRRQIRTKGFRIQCSVTLQTPSRAKSSRSNQPRFSLLTTSPRSSDGAAGMIRSLSESSRSAQSVKLNLRASKRVSKLIRGGETCCAT